MQMEQKNTIPAQDLRVPMQESANLAQEFHRPIAI
jgi:hypothetical protein